MSTRGGLSCPILENISIQVTVEREHSERGTKLALRKFTVSYSIVQYSTV